MKFNKIIAIGDLHGDFQVFKKVLSMCKLIDVSGDWTGGDTHVIQVGDTLDGKRPGVKQKLDPNFLNESGEIEIMKYLLKLDCQAKTSNGRVISLLGNHELYPYYLQNDENFMKDYVKTKDIKQFKKIYNTSRIKFLSPGGLGGSLFGRTRPLMLQLGEFIFVHGSITDKLINSSLNKSGKVDIDKINTETSLWLQGKGSVPVYLQEMGDDNPVFSRLYSKDKDFTPSECEKIKNQLSLFNNAKYVVMGHSRYKEINITCNKMLIRTDVSLSRAFGGNLSSKNYQALEISQFSDKDPELNIITPTGRVPI
jgi:hypothetical protein